MLSIIFAILMIAIFGRLIVFAFKAAWTVSKVLVTLVFLPIILIGMAFSGFLTIAMILLIIVGIASFFA